MKNVFLINKKEGETPLEALEKLRGKKKISKDIKMTYAGRLDPIASGLLLILAGKETKNKEKYLALDKEYEFEILFGFATDTYDILGKVTHSIILTNSRIAKSKQQLEKEIKKNLKFFTGKFTQKYPLYSSKTVKGKPLFEYARAGKEVKIPTRVVNVKSLKFIKLRTISSTQLLNNISKRIKKVNGNFRQKEILTTWSKYLRTSKLPYNVASFKIKCSSGTYVRGIANSLGGKMNLSALAFSIKRTKIGKWSKSGVKY
jgi:tRNA pseudouridine55 synthase